jgi:ribosomal-protein-alanine N-acetyltransferase
MEITFRPADPDLAEFFYEHRQDPINLRHNPLIPSTIEMLRERLSKANSHWDDFESAESFFWFLEHESRLVGISSVQNINRMMLTAEIGYGISPEFRGKGLATLAVRQLTESAFEKTPLRKLIAFVHDQNLASCRVLEKASYRREGILREHFLINGAPANEVIYGILRKEIS